MVTLEPRSVMLPLSVSALIPTTGHSESTSSSCTLTSVGTLVHRGATFYHDRISDTSGTFLPWFDGTYGSYMDVNRARRDSYDHSGSWHSELHMLAKRSRQRGGSDDCGRDASKSVSHPRARCRASRRSRHARAAAPQKVILNVEFWILNGREKDPAASAPFFLSS